jgi:uncharacterized heparinase superfamily protein
MRGIDRALLYLRTIASLQPRQWAYLPIRKLQRRLAVPVRSKRIGLSPHTDALSRAVAGFGPRNGDFIARADRVLSGRFTFIGQEIALERIDWRNRHVSHLWSYNLHYFDYALDLVWAWREIHQARYASGFVGMARDWIAGNESGRGDGWEPYPVATRAVNWIYAVLLLRGSLTAQEESELLESIHSQLLALEQRIEWHLLANHLQRNLQALAVGSLVFAGRDADRWRQKWLPRLWNEVSNQVLADGGHFERSPMYHAIAMADLLETKSLAEAAGERIPSEASARLSLMLGAARAMTRTDGSLQLFNDAANGIAPAFAYLARLAGNREPGTGGGSISLPDTGYFGFENDDVRLLIDCGEPGPRYQSGHAHCDLLSFELDLAGRPFIVDSGVSGYEGDPLREYVRSTRAHNTITIDGKDQHEVWGTYRMARHATVKGAAQHYSAAGYEFRGSYSPYHARRVTHSREFAYANGTLGVIDRVDGADGRRIQSFLHFAPDVSVEIESQRAIAHAQQRRVEIVFSGFDSLEVVKGASEPTQGWHCPEFGRAIPAAGIVATIRAAGGAPFGYTINTTR